jgi:hypothetical protein
MRGFKQLVDDAWFSVQMLLLWAIIGILAAIAIIRLIP